MDYSRRQLLLAGLGLVATGCTPQYSTPLGRPGPTWPDVGGRRVLGPPIIANPPVRSHANPPEASAHPFAVIPRSVWTRHGPIAGKINPMNGINRITVHHEGWKLFTATSQRITATRIEQIRKVHTDSPRGWGDIGYHYVIDRAGRIWQGRDIRYQGAHVRANNPHNLGIMLLGNFQKQKPSGPQLDSLAQALKALRAKYGVPIRRIYTHRELMPTDCPGKNLQPLVVTMRTHRYLG